MLQPILCIVPALYRKIQIVFAIRPRSISSEKQSDDSHSDEPTLRNWRDWRVSGSMLIERYAEKDGGHYGASQTPDAGVEYETNEFQLEHGAKLP